MTAEKLTIGEYLESRKLQLKNEHITTCRVITACGHCYFDGSPEELAESLLQVLTIQQARRNKTNPQIVDIETV